ncbi:hypothetical protein PENTCL1PPCAC_6237, partial [Pristionchus entomophagus]
NENQSKYIHSVRKKRPRRISHPYHDLPAGFPSDNVFFISANLLSALRLASYFIHSSFRKRGTLSGSQYSGVCLLILRCISPILRCMSSLHIQRT